MATSIQRSISLLGLVSVLSIFGCRCHRTQRSADPRPEAPRASPLSKRFTAEQPFAFVLPQLQDVQGVGGVRARDCGVCHQAIYKEWQATTHAWALRDIQYQAELFKPSSPRWLCLNCHIPVQNQRRKIVTGLIDGDVMRPATRPNPGFDADMQQEAITCAVCHVRPDAKGRSQIVGPRGNPEAPHPVRRDGAALRDVCYRCHDPRGERITPLLVCWFETRKELADGPFAKKGCADCHMSTTRRRLAAAFDVYPERETHAHHWAGGGVPKSFDGYPGLRARGYEPGLEVHKLTVTPSPDGKQVAFSLDFENARAGHKLPTADPERHLLLLAWLEDASGQRHAVTRARIGQTWTWHPRAEKKGDNRLAPRERRRWEQRLEVPTGLGKGKGKLVVTAYHVRLTGKTVEHMRKAKVEATYIKGIEAQVRQLQRHYPMASYLYREEVDLGSGKQTRLSLDELIALSRAEQRKSLSKRDY